jgi:hypothetical protein
VNFGQALESLKDGERVARSGWNGKGMWLHLVQENAAGLRDLRDQQFKTRAYIEMKDATDMYVPWLASQTDMLAEDWEIV